MYEMEIIPPEIAVSIVKFLNAPEISNLALSCIWGYQMTHIIPVIPKTVKTIMYHMGCINGVWICNYILRSNKCQRNPLNIIPTADYSRLLLSQIKGSVGDNDIAIVYYMNLCLPGDWFQIVYRCDNKDEHDAIQQKLKNNTSGIFINDYQWIDEIPVDIIDNYLTSGFFDNSIHK